MPNESRPPLDDLIRKAFAAAKASGREHWATMTLPVLKNRLLQETDRAFDEKTYGFGSFRELIRQAAAELVSLDEDSRPPQVHLKQRTTRPAPRRIRQDIWRAILDYSSGNAYVWDESARCAVPVDDSSDDRLRIPTVDADILDDWRIRFLEQTLPLVEENAVAEKLKKWQAEGLGTSFLPGPYRGAWNEFLKRQIRERWTTWAAEKGVELPFEDVDEPAPASHKGTGPVTILVSDNLALPSAEGLRRFLIRCIHDMTSEELAHVALPSSVIFRLLSRS